MLNRLTSEDRERLSEVMARIEDIDADSLAEAALIAQQDGAFLREFAGVAMQELRRRMNAVDVKELPTADVLVTIGAPKKDYRWDFHALDEKVRPLLLPGEWEQLVKVIPPPEPKTYFKAETRKILSLAEKRKGELAEAVTASLFVAESEGPVNLSRIPEVAS